MVKATVAESTVRLPCHHHTTEDVNRRKQRLKSWNKKGKMCAALNILTIAHWPDK